MMPEATPPVAQLVSVSHRYGTTTALDDVSIDICAGRMIGLIGPDGVGKSTLLGLVAGARKIQTGHVTVLGGDMATRGYRDAACLRIAYMPQGLGATCTRHCRSGRTSIFSAGFSASPRPSAPGGSMICCTARASVLFRTAPPASFQAA